MTLYLEQPGRFPVWRGEAIGEGDDAISYPLNIDILSAEELEAIGLWRDDMIAPAAAITEGKIAVGTGVERVSGVVTFVHDLADPTPPASDDVDAERDRRISAGFTFAGVAYQSRPEDRENITGASLAALAAMMNGAQPGDLRWHGGDSDFMWIAADNTVHHMDAQTVFAFGQTAMAHQQGIIFAARALKDADPIPLDYTDDAYWP